MEGYLVLQKSVYRDGPAAAIVDWEATSAEIEADLIDAVIERANLQELVLWSAALPDRMRTVLQRKAFVQWDSPWRSAALIRPTHNERLDGEWDAAKRNILDLKNWYLRMIHSDGA